MQKIRELKMEYELLINKYITEHEVINIYYQIYVTYTELLIAWVKIN